MRDGARAALFCDRRERLPVGIAADVPVGTPNWEIPEDPVALPAALVPAPVPVSRYEDCPPRLGETSVCALMLSSRYFSLVTSGFLRVAKRAFELDNPI